jgi:uncharacterized protein YjbJ (UPF0337 family)
MPFWFPSSMPFLEKRHLELPKRRDVVDAEDMSLSSNTRHGRLPMNWNQVEGNWEQFKGKAQTQWGKLTGDDLDVVAGKRKELSGKIQAAYGKTQEEADREIDDWMSKN